MRVGVIDYGVGNAGSVMRALEELRVVPVRLFSPENIDSVDRLILPGVGNFADCIKILERDGWRVALQEKVNVEGKPLLGICLGMQLLATTSMEGLGDNEEACIGGLNLIPGRVESLRKLGCSLRVPHVGWNEVFYNSNEKYMFNQIPDGSDFYFVHSYAYLPDDENHLIATSTYGIKIAAAIRRGHIWGTQFHPEKSSRAGFQLLKNFIEAAIC